MWRIYDGLRVDEVTLRFYIACPLCGARRDSYRLPFLCRDNRKLGQLKAGSAAKRRQKAYDRRKDAAASSLARQLNLCPICGRWVCDRCYDADDDKGACRHCTGHTAGAACPQKEDTGQTQNSYAAEKPMTSTFTIGGR